MIFGRVRIEPISEEQPKVTQLYNKAQAIQTKTIIPNSNDNNVVNIVCNKQQQQ